MNTTRIRRLWRLEGLTCKPKARKKHRTGPGAGEQKRLRAQYPMPVVSFDFQSDVTSCGRHIRFFNVIDEYTRTALAVIPRRSFTAADVIAVLEGIIAETGSTPTYVRSDNGPEFTAAALTTWCNMAGVETAFIDPGSPWQNGYAEALECRTRHNPSTPNSEGNSSPEKLSTPWTKPATSPRNGKISTIMNGPTDPSTA